MCSGRDAVASTRSGRASDQIISARRSTPRWARRGVMESRGLSGSIKASVAGCLSAGNHFCWRAMSPTLLVLAAGMGSRYGGLKQIDPVGPGGETIIDYSIYDALRAGFGKLVFVIRHDIEQPFKETIGARFEKQLPVEYVFQELDKLPP